MSSGQRIIKNSVFLTTSQVTAKLVNFLLILILTRYLGREGFGLYSYSFAYVSMFYFLTHMGISNLLIKDVARQKDSANDYISYSLPLVLLLSSAFLIIVNAIPIILNWNSNERFITLFFSIYFLFDALGKYFYAIMQAFERMGYQAVLFAAERISLLLSSLYCWYTNQSLVTLVAFFSIVIGIKTLVSYIIVNKEFVQISLSWQPSRFKPILKDSYPFALVLLFSAVSARADLLILRGFHSTEFVAIYSTARKIIEALSFLPENIAAAVFPSLAYFFVSQRNKFNETFRQSFLVIILIAIPIGISLFILSPRIINLLFEPEFSDAYIPLRWLSIGLLILYLRMGLSVVLNTTGNQHIFALIYGISMLVNIFTNFILVPKFDTLGASLAVIFSELSLVLCSLVFIRKYVDFSWAKTLVPKLIFTIIIFSSVIYFIQDYNFAIILISATFVYLASIFVLRILTFSDFKQYYALLTKRTDQG